LIVIRNLRILLASNKRNFFHPRYSENLDLTFIDYQTDQGKIDTFKSENLCADAANLIESAIAKRLPASIGSYRQPIFPLPLCIFMAAPRMRMLAANSAAAPHRFMVFRPAITATAWLLAAMMGFVHSRPGSALRFFLRNTALFVALFNMLSLALLFFGILALIAPWHSLLPFKIIFLLIALLAQILIFIASRAP
jgi:hypothetical protein